MSRPPPPPDPKRPAPFLTRRPWAGFSAREHPRAQALALCPSPRCRRVKACVAAHGGLFCQRTHISHAEHLALHPPPPPRLTGHSPQELELFREELAAALAEAQAQHKALTARWKAGEFDALYGKWRARGVLMHPPPKCFGEGKG